MLIFNAKEVARRATKQHKPLINKLFQIASFSKNIFRSLNH
ncbi:hypothetical protein AsAng_0039240 [Aureispira anguillae]|uniref:Uncharacterized protein n=1 Tax=Aureispira anguillae TaxID=2864201 RepID=A0A916DV59_9BACT|nr:hypothetical protein AsAng_0039240 [Aureispira anguillae]